jgi:hypothetical protein
VAEWRTAWLGLKAKGLSRSSAANFIAASRKLPPIAISTIRKKLGA